MNNIFEEQHVQTAGNPLEPLTTTPFGKPYGGSRLIAGSDGKKVKGLGNPHPSS